MEEALVAMLLADSGIRELAANRLTWGRAVQGISPPYATMHVITGLRDVTHSGPSGLKTTRVQIDCYGTTPLQARQLARAVETKLSGFSGTHGAIRFEGVFMDSERDGFDDDATTAKFHRVSTDYLIWHKGV